MGTGTCQRKKNESVKGLSHDHGWGRKYLGEGLFLAWGGREYVNISSNPVTCDLVAMKGFTF